MAKGKLEWREPWSRTTAREKFAEARAAMPPSHRMVLWCVAAPLAALTAIHLGCPGLDVPAVRDWRGVAWGTAAIAFLVWGLPLLVVVLCPVSVVLQREWIVFVQGNSALRIPADRVTAIRFLTAGGRRWFVVETRTRKGTAAARRVGLSPKGPSEGEIAAFLQEAGLGHLCRAE